jgi:hypothetical protein
VGRDPGEVQRSVTVLVELDAEAARRPHGDDESPPLAVDDVPAHLSALAEAGADEAILVLRPIDEPSIRTLGRALGLE